MKAKVLETGEIVDVDFSHKANTREIYFYKDLKTKEMYNKDGLVFLDDENTTHEIDWEQRRYELTKSAMQGILTNMTRGSAFSDYEDRVAIQSIKYADAVIAKLKEE